jgi:peptidoglycan/LPS O-acetylase OafA/YrhL
MKRVFGLDVLRTLAIAQVLLGHGMSIYLGEGSKSLFEGFYGFLGVELFFVLSGFLIGSIALAAFESAANTAVLRDFMSRRWLRTLPNYYLFLGVNVVMAAWLGGGGFQPRYLVFLQNLFWPMPAFFGESWSLAVEELFYLFLPLWLLAARRWTVSPAGLLGALVAALIAFAAVRLIDVAAFHPDFHAVVRKTAGLRLDSLMYGVIAAWLARHARAAFLRRRGWRLVLGAALVVISVRTVVALAPGDPLGASLALSGVSLGVAFTLPFLSTWQTGSALARAVFGWSSRISYALYLCHLPTSRILQHFGLAHGLGALLAFIAASCVVATVVYHAFERPFLRLRDQLPRPAAAPATAAESLPA